MIQHRSLSRDVFDAFFINQENVSSGIEAVVDGYVIQFMKFTINQKISKITKRKNLVNIMETPTIVTRY